MSVFSDSLDVIYGTDIAQDATYTPPGGQPQDVRLVPAQDDAIANFGLAAVQGTRAIFKARTSELVSPVAGGVITLNEENFTIKAPPRRADPDRLEWTLECNPS